MELWDAKYSGKDQGVHKEAKDQKAAGKEEKVKKTMALSKCKCNCECKHMLSGQGEILEN